MPFSIFPNIQNNTVTCILAFIIGVLVPALFAYSYIFPVPQIHDEFAYLLQADTFSQGRLTNPTHALYPFFETFHVFQTPTYQAKYPPGQGLILALGEYISSSPAAGLWLSAGLACLALTWLLIAFLPSHWALLTTLLFLLNPALFMSWSQSYWGGYVAFIGGSLYFGGLFRLIKSKKISTYILMVSGLFILSISRPFEGLVTLAISSPYLIWSWHKESILNGNQQALRGYIKPLIYGAAAIILFQLIYNYTVSDNPFKYVYLNWTYKDSAIELIRNYSGSPQISMQTELIRAYNFFYPSFLGAILFALIFVKEKKVVLLMTLWILVITFVSSATTPAWPHYLAPVAPLNYLLLGMALHGLSTLSIQDRSIGKIIAPTLAIAFIIYFSFTVINISRVEPPYTWGRVKQDISNQLNKNKEKALVFVRYSKNHNTHAEWVYNDANIDQSPVVWARDLGDKKNGLLIEYFPDRLVWLLETDKRPISMSRYITR